MNHLSSYKLESYYYTLELGSKDYRSLYSAYILRKPRFCGRGGRCGTDMSVYCATISVDGQRVYVFSGLIVLIYR